MQRKLKPTCGTPHLAWPATAGPHPKTALQEPVGFLHTLDVQEGVFHQAQDSQGAGTPEVANLEEDAGLGNPAQNGLKPKLSGSSVWDWLEVDFAAVYPLLIRLVLDQNEKPRILFIVLVR